MSISYSYNLAWYPKIEVVFTLHNSLRTYFDRGLAAGFKYVKTLLS